MSIILNHIVAIIICCFIWSHYTKGSNNNWSRIPHIIRLPLLISAVYLAGLCGHIAFAFVRLLPGIVEAICNWFVIIFCFFAGIDIEKAGAIIEPIWGIMGDIIVSPYVLGMVFFISTFPEFKNDRVRTLIYRLLALIEITGFLLYTFWIHPSNELSSLDNTIFIIEAIGCALFTMFFIIDDFRGKT